MHKDMKRIYNRPEMAVLAIGQMNGLLAGSEPPSGRNANVEGDNSFPSDIPDATDNDDGMGSGRGQGSGGSGNSAKGMIWDEW